MRVFDEGEVLNSIRTYFVHFYPVTRLKNKYQGGMVYGD